MTEEIIKNITDAEAQAAQIKREAQERAAAIIAAATERAARLETSSAEVCKAYRESQMKTALADAEREYAQTLGVKTREAKEYCEKALQNSEVSVAEIVGRIVGGDC